MAQGEQGMSKRTSDWIIAIVTLVLIVVATIMWAIEGGEPYP